jgi:hypothetical protein
MSTDRELVIKSPVKITISTTPPTNADLQLEYCFATKLLERLTNASYNDLNTFPYFYHFLIDLIAQNVTYRDDLQISEDDSGNTWLRLRGKTPYRERGFYSDTTTLVNRVGSLVRIIFAEKDDDVDNWYRYEWISGHLKEVLATESSGVAGNVNVGDQRALLRRIFNKFSKFLAQQPG